jgi:hypothetical protein
MQSVARKDKGKKEDNFVGRCDYRWLNMLQCNGKPGRQSVLEAV